LKALGALFAVQIQVQFVIPREGVESENTHHYVIDLVEDAVIPREGVESSMPGRRGNQVLAQVIPREGVESMWTSAASNHVTTTWA